MGCDLVYVNRTLVQLRTGKNNYCRIWYAESNTEVSKTPIAIRTSLGPNEWRNTYLSPPKGTRDLTKNKYYSVEGVDTRNFFVDSVGDAWLFQSRIDFEAAIATYTRQGPSFHLNGAVHYSQVLLPKKDSPIASRYDRIMGNRIVEPVEQSPAIPEKPEPYDEIKEILDLEFNKTAPKELKNPLGIDFEAILKEILKT